MESVKKVLGWLAAAGVVVLAGLAYFFKAKSDKANSRVGQLEAEKQLGEILKKKEEAEEDAILKEIEYKRLRDLYLSTHPDHGDESDDK